MANDGVVLGPGEGREVSPRGLRVGFKATGARTPAGPTFLELTAAPGFDTGAHVHAKIEEMFYVVEGEAEFRVGDRTLRAKPGTFVFLPPGVAHSFGNPGSTPAKCVFVSSPHGHERYFEELAEILAKDGPPDTAAIAELRRRYDTEEISPLVARS
jgi:mannose-6-phosphate isomerase-like protein (cupin superfamily)